MNIQIRICQELKLVVTNSQAHHPLHHKYIFGGEVENKTKNETSEIFKNKM